MADKRVPIHLALILDRSGSMEPQRAALLAGVNQYLDLLRQDPFARYRVRLVLFDDTLRVVHEDIPLEEMRPLTREDYVTGGQTALLDAIGFTLQTMTQPGADEIALVAVYTDGMENASKEFDFGQIRDMIRIRELTGRWTIAYLGARPEGASEARRMGFSQGSCGTVEDVQESFEFLGISSSESSSRHYRARQSGSQAAPPLDFFDPEALKRLQPPRPGEDTPLEGEAPPEPQA